ncbi:single-stranded DNA-binding protein [Thiomonas sp.]
MASNKHQDFQSHTCSGNVATVLESFAYKNRAGEQKEAKKFRLASNQGSDTVWYQVNIFDPKLASVLEKHAAVGRRVVVNGRLKVSAYTGREGPVPSLQLDAMAVNFMDMPPEDAKALPPMKTVDDGLLHAWSLFMKPYRR